MASKRGKSKKKNPCWKGYTAMGSDGQIVMKKKGEKMVPACRPIKGKKDGASASIFSKDSVIQPAIKKEIFKSIKSLAPLLKNGASMKDKDNGYTYTTSESPKAKKQRLKEERKKRVLVIKPGKSTTTKNGFQASELKAKDVKTKRADRMVKRGWTKARQV